MNAISIEQIRKLWPRQPRSELSRFLADVLVAAEDTEQILRCEFVVLAVDRWMAAVCTEFSEVTRFFICRNLLKDQGFRAHTELLESEGKIPSFLLSVFDGRYVSWTGVEQAIELPTFRKISALPMPHVWATILGVTPLYLRLMQTLEDLEHDDRDNQPGQCQAQNDH